MRILFSQFIPCVPPKATKQGYKIIKKGKFSSLAKSDRARAAEDTIMGMFAQYAPDELFGGPLWVKLMFAFPMPKSAKKADKDRGWRWMVQRPDIDNLCKLFIDAIAPRYFQDDSNIVYLNAGKYQHKSKTGIYLEIREINVYNSLAFDEPEHKGGDAESK